MTRETFKALFAARWGSPGLAALLVAVVSLFVTAGVPSGAEGQDHPLHEGDPSLGLAIGKESRFSKPVSFVGEVWMVEAHDSAGNHPFLKLLVTEDERRFGLYGDRAESLRLGSRVRVSGRLAREAADFEAAVRGDILLDEVTVLENPSGNRTGVEPRVERAGKQGFIAAFLSWPGSGPSNFTAVGESVSGLTEWSEQASGGVFSWDPAIAVNVALDRPLAPCGADGSAPIDAWVFAVRRALIDKGYDIEDDFRGLGIAMPEGASICRQGGETAYAFYSAGCNWMQYSLCGLSIYSARYSTSLDVFAHELGHNLGLPHANSAPCLSGGTPVVLGYGGQTECRSQEYLDYLDPMGISYLRSWTNYFNPVYSDALGWIPSREIERVPRGQPTDREVALAPFSAFGKKRVATVGLPAVQGPSGPQFPGRIYIDYRTRTGLDSMLWDDGAAGRWFCPDGASDAVYLRLAPSGAGRQLIGLGTPPYGAPIDDSFLLDMVPSTSPAHSWQWICDAGLQPGDSWQDPTGKLEVEFLSRSSDLSSATVRIKTDDAEAGSAALKVGVSGDGKGKVTSDDDQINCGPTCSATFVQDTVVTLNAAPERGSRFKSWSGDCVGIRPVCKVDMTAARNVRAEFETLPPPDIDLSSIQLSPANLKVKAGKKAQLTVQVTNNGLDGGQAKVALSSSSSGKATVPASVSFKVPGESSATKSFTVTTKKKQKGKVTITAKLGSQTARASLALAR